MAPPSRIGDDHLNGRQVVGELRLRHLGSAVASPWLRRAALQHGFPWLWQRNPSKKKWKGLETLEKPMFFFSWQSENDSWKFDHPPNMKRPYMVPNKCKSFILYKTMVSAGCLVLGRRNYRSKRLKLSQTSLLFFRCEGVTTIQILSTINNRGKLGVNQHI